MVFEVMLPKDYLFDPLEEKQPRGKRENLVTPTQEDHCLYSSKGIEKNHIENQEIGYKTRGRDI